MLLWPPFAIQSRSRRTSARGNLFSEGFGHMDKVSATPVMTLADHRFRGGNACA
jgi:hypothetical protein